MLLLDGAYTFEREKPRFHRAPAPSSAALERSLPTVAGIEVQYASNQGVSNHQTKGSECLKSFSENQ